MALFFLDRISLPVIFLFMNFYLITEVAAALRSELTTTSDCICPGFSLTYECTVKGTIDGFTVWRGSAFNCASNEITLRHRRFMLEGAMGQCNDGAIVGKSLRVNGSFYISTLSIKVNSDMIGESIECLHDGINITIVGYSLINATTGPFLPPDDLHVSLADLGSGQLNFSWNKVAPNCPAIHYGILATNCGSCPTTTNHTTITCIDVPIDQNIFCTFALQTIVCGNIAGILSNPISVSLSASSLREEIVNRSTINNQNCLLDAKNSSGYILGALVSVSVLFTVSMIVLTTIIIALVRNKIRLQTQLITHNTTSESELKIANTKVDTKKNIAYEPNSAAVDTKKNICYEPNPAAVDTRKNVAYETNTVAIDIKN